MNRADRLPDNLDWLYEPGLDGPVDRTAVDRFLGIDPPGDPFASATVAREHSPDAFAFDTAIGNARRAWNRTAECRALLGAVGRYHWEADGGLFAVAPAAAVARQLAADLPAGTGLGERDAQIMLRVLVETTIAVASPAPHGFGAVRTSTGALLVGGSVSQHPNTPEIDREGWGRRPMDSFDLFTAARQVANVGAFLFPSATTAPGLVRVGDLQPVLADQVGLEVAAAEPQSAWLRSLSSTDPWTPPTEQCDPAFIGGLARVLPQGQFAALIAAGAHRVSVSEPTGCLYRHSLGGLKAAERMVRDRPDLLAAALGAASDLAALPQATREAFPQADLDGLNTVPWSQLASDAMEELPDPGQEPTGPGFDKPGRSGPDHPKPSRGRRH